MPGHTQEGSRDQIPRLDLNLTSQVFLPGDVIKALAPLPDADGLQAQELTFLLNPVTVLPSTIPSA